MKPGARIRAHTAGCPPRGLVENAGRTQPRGESNSRSLSDLGSDVCEFVRSESRRVVEVERGGGVRLVCDRRRGEEAKMRAGSVDAPGVVVQTGTANGRFKATSPRVRRLLGTFVSLFLLSASLAGASAHAQIVHQYTGVSFGPGGVGVGGFGEVVGVAVDQVSSDVFVLDQAEGGRVYKFDSSGAPVDFSSTGTNVIEGVGSAFGAEAEIAVDSSAGPDAGDIYVANEQGVRIYSEAGALLGELSGGEMCGVAVGSTGTVYVGIYPSTVRRYVPVANPATNADEISGALEGLSNVCNVAVDGSGDVYAAAYFGGVTKYDAQQFGSVAAIGTVVDQSGKTLTVSGSDNEVLIDETEDLVQYDGSREPPAQDGASGKSGPGALLSSFGVAVNDASGMVYVGNSGSVEIFGPGVALPPSLSGGRFSEVGFTSSEVSGTVEARGETVSYLAEYGLTTAYGSDTQAATMALGDEPTEVHVELNDLQPATTYHVRLVASNQNGTSRGADVTFTTHIPTSNLLPDDRGYEKVSPNANADSNVYQDAIGFGVLAAEYTQSNLPFAVADDGKAIAYVGGSSEAGGTGFEGIGQGNEYLATRTSTGWDARNITPVSTGFLDVPTYQAFSPDLSAGVLEAQSPLAVGAPGGGYTVLYERSFASQDYQPLVTNTPPNRSAEEFGAWDPLKIFGKIWHAPDYAGSSADRSHLLFVANDALTENALDEGVAANNLYDFHDGTTTLVNVLPGGSTEANATFGGPPSWGEKDEVPAFGHDISADGSRIFWTDLNTHDLYVRENDTAPQSPEVAGHCTVASDACTVLIAANAQFWDASADGSRVLYSHEGDLYEYDLALGASTDLAPGAETLGIVGASEDLSYVYFVGDGAVAPGATHQKCSFASSEGQEQEEEAGKVTPTAGCNLYVVHVGSGIRFIARLSRYDSRNQYFEEAQAGGWEAGLADKEAQATPDGLHLLFVSRRSLTGFQANLRTEAYLYDAASGQITCVSCDQSGESPGQHLKGSAGSSNHSALLPLSKMKTALPHWISNDGNRIFFDSLDPLVPQDSNGTTDVYEWERAGTGTCTFSPGCIYLLSDGTSTEGSFLIGSSTTGDDVFFTTRGQVLPEDENQDVDVYDARVGAALPPTSTRCIGQGCQGVPSAPPVFATPASATYAGVGNFPSPLARRVARRLEPPTRARRLAKALRVCARGPKGKRVRCRVQARRRYGPKRQAKKARRAGHPAAEQEKKTAMRSARSKGGKR